MGNPNVSLLRTNPNPNANPNANPNPNLKPEPEPKPKPKPTPNQVSLPLNPLGKIDVGGGVGKGALQAGWSFEHP